MSKAEAIRHWLRNGGDVREQDLPDPNRPLKSAKDGKDLRPRRRTGPFLRVRHNGEFLR